MPYRPDDSWKEFGIVLSRMVDLHTLVLLLVQPWPSQVEHGFGLA